MTLVDVAGTAGTIASRCDRCARHDVALRNDGTAPAVVVAGVLGRRWPDIRPSRSPDERLRSPPVTSLARSHLLSSVQMARSSPPASCASIGVVPVELDERVLAELDAGLAPFLYGTPLDQVHPPGSALADVLRVPAVAGAIQSLVGPHPTADHQFLHVRGPREGEAQPLHADAVIDAAGRTPSTSR